MPGLIIDKNELYLGIDTSCYTTSLAVMTDSGAFQLKKMLAVKQGECGLRQSDALFQHIKNTPELFEELGKKVELGAYDKVYVTVSSRPRSVEGSYMPVFLAGQSFGRAIAAALGAKYCEVSHQDGHIMAALYSCKKLSLLGEPFLSVHLSGGTTEILLVNQTECGFECEPVGGTKDLPAGQFIDRIGVRLGMDFPCGSYMDYAAMDYEGKEKVRTCVKDGFINFSGEETRYERLIADGMELGRAAYCVMKCVSESVKAAVLQVREKCGVKSVVMAGGVSSSAFMRGVFSDMEEVYFAEPSLSCDNAVGVCALGNILKGREA